MLGLAMQFAEVCLLNHGRVVFELPQEAGIWALLEWIEFEDRLNLKELTATVVLLVSLARVGCCSESHGAYAQVTSACFSMSISIDVVGPINMKSP